MEMMQHFSISAFEHFLWAFPGACDNAGDEIGGRVFG